MLRSGPHGRFFPAAAAQNSTGRRTPSAVSTSVSLSAYTVAEAYGAVEWGEILEVGFREHGEL